MVHDPREWLCGKQCRVSKRSAIAKVGYKKLIILATNGTADLTAVAKNVGSASAFGNYYVQSATVNPRSESPKWGI